MLHADANDNTHFNVELGLKGNLKPPLSFTLATARLRLRWNRFSTQVQIAIVVVIVIFVCVLLCSPLVIGKRAYTLVNATTNRANATLSTMPTPVVILDQGRSAAETERVETEKVETVRVVPSIPPQVVSIVNYPPPPPSWAGIAEIGPDSSPAAWQASQPSVLLMAYAGWTGIYAASCAQGPTLATFKFFDSIMAQRLVTLISQTPSLRVVAARGCI